MYPMRKLLLWCVNTTFLIVVVFLVSTHLEMGERGAYINAIFSVLFIMAYILARGQSISEVWVTACLTTAFSVGAAATVLTLVTVVMKQEYGDYGLMVGIFAIFLALATMVCMFFFSLITAAQLKLKYHLVLLPFIIQGLILYLVFAFGPSLMHRFFVS